MWTLATAIFADLGLWQHIVVSRASRPVIGAFAAQGRVCCKAQGAPTWSVLIAPFV